MSKTNKTKESKKVFIESPEPTYTSEAIKEVTMIVKEKQKL